MKRTFHSLVLIFCISTSASAQNYYDVSEFRDQLPELKQTDVVNFSKKDSNAFVTSCSLDTVSRILYYYHCYGGLFSYQRMSKPDMNAILAKKITPFEYFDLVTTFNVNLIEKAKKNLEDNGSNAKFTSLEKQYLDIADSVKFPSTLTKLLELDKQMVNLEVEDTRFHSVNPKYIKRDRSYYKTFNDLQGQMVIWRLSDSIATFYSKSDAPPVYKAVLDLKKAVICFYNRSDSLIDKIEINKNKVALLASKESDVFALYRMWLEWKRQSITQAIEETKISGRVAENKQYALNVLSEQVKMLSAIEYKIEYFTNADKQFVLQKLRRQFGAIFAPNDPWETGRLVYHTRGDKRYELTDHRGNVMAVISDMKRGVPRKDDSTKVDHYEAIVLGATDYTPFGNPMQGRSFNSDKYPYGYNGKEDDNETGYQNYGMRIYDPKVARFLSVDPITSKYPMLTPYQFASNSPIAAVDLDGLEILPINSSMYRQQFLGRVNILKVSYDRFIVQTVYDNIPNILKNPSTRDFKFTGGGPVTAFGRDWDVKVDGAYVARIGRYYNEGSGFFGKAADAEPESTNSTTGLYSSKQSSNPLSENADAASQLSSAANAPEQVTGIVNNLLPNTQNTWKAIAMEKKDRSAFYDATNLVDKYFKPNLIGERDLRNGQGRVNLINFLTDGVLPAGSTAAKDLSKADLEYNLKIMFTGIQLAYKGAIDIKPETSKKFGDFNDAYREKGGTINFGEIYQLKRPGEK